MSYLIGNDGMTVTIPGENITSEADLHKYLGAELAFGPYYGGNLAALRDRLTTDVERPVTLIWKNSALSRSQLGYELFDRIVKLFREVETQDAAYGWEDRFTMTLE